jgi:hypothetical protein
MSQPFTEPCDRGLIEVERCPRDLSREIADSRKRVVLAACVLATSTAFIDSSALTVALPILLAYFAVRRFSVNSDEMKSPPKLSRVMESSIASSRRPQ